MFDRHQGDVDGGGLAGAGPTVPVERTAPFDRASLRRMVTEIRHYLAELRYVDSVLPFVHEPERLRDTDPWPPYPGGPTFHDTIPKDVRLTLGTTFPFPVAITYSYPVTREYIDLYLAQLASSAQRWADDNIATLTARLTPIIRPEVSTYDQIRDHLDAVETGLALHVSDDFGQLANNLNDSIRGGYRVPDTTDEKFLDLLNQMSLALIDEIMDYLPWRPTADASPTPDCER